MESMTVGKIKPQSDFLEEMLERKIDKTKGRGQKGKTERKKKKEIQFQNVFTLHHVVCYTPTNNSQAATAYSGVPLRILGRVN